MLIYLKAQMGLAATSHFEVGTVSYNDRDGFYNLSIENAIVRFGEDVLRAVNK